MKQIKQEVKISNIKSKKNMLKKEIIPRKEKDDEKNQNLKETPKILNKQRNKFSLDFDKTNKTHNYSFKKRQQTKTFNPSLTSPSPFKKESIVKTVKEKPKTSNKFPTNYKIIKKTKSAKETPLSGLSNEEKEQILTTLLDEKTEFIYNSSNNIELTSIKTPNLSTVVNQKDDYPNILSTNNNFNTNSLNVSQTQKNPNNLPFSRINTFTSNSDLITNINIREEIKNENINNNELFIRNKYKSIIDLYFMENQINE